MQVLVMVGGGRCRRRRRCRPLDQCRIVSLRRGSPEKLVVPFGVELGAPGFARFTPPATRMIAAPARGRKESSSLSSGGPLLGIACRYRTVSDVQRLASAPAQSPSRSTGMGDQETTGGVMRLTARTRIIV